MTISNELLFDILMTMMISSLLLGIATWSLIFALSFYFRKLDKNLLVNPFFNESEQQNYKEFPLSLYKTLIYINLFSVRKMTGKRFQGASIPQPGKDITYLSHLGFIMEWTTIAFGTITFLLMFYLYSKI